MQAAASLTRSPVVALCEQLLEAARRGEITSIVAVTVNPRAVIATPGEGAQLMEMMVGLDIVKRRLLETVATPSPIIRQA
jgi:hypothetical protein